MPNLNTSLTIDLVQFWETGAWTVLDHQFREYNGNWELAKGDNSLKAGEQQQVDFNKSLQAVFQAQYGDQKAILDYLNPILKSYISNPQGVTPAALTAMRTSASDTIAQQGANAKQAVQATEAAKGGGTGLPSGVEAQIEGQMAVGQAAQQSAAQNDITKYDESVRQSNFWNATAALSGNAKMLDPTAYAGTANQGSGELAGLGTAYYNSQQSGWLNAALGGLGAAAGGWASGGFKMPGGK